MVSPLWLERYRRELTRRKLPFDYVDRLVQELADHFTDLTEEGESTESAACSRLGDPNVVAEAALQEFRQRSVLNRRPLLAFGTFVLLPIPLLTLAWVLVSAVLFLIGELIPDETTVLREITPMEVVVAHLFVNAFIVVPAAVVAVFYARLAQKTVRNRLWSIVSCLLLATVTGLIFHQQTFSEEPGKSTITVGIPIAPHFRGINSTQLAQFAVPMGIGLLALRRQRFAAVPAGSTRPSLQ